MKKLDDILKHSLNKLSTVIQFFSYLKFKLISFLDVLKIIGKPFNEIQINPKWGFELINKNGIVYFQVKTSTGLFSQELIISAFLKAMKLQTESFMGTQNHIKEIRLSTNFRLSQSQKDIFKKAAAKNNLEILLFNVSDM